MREIEDSPSPITNNGSPYFARFDLGKLLSEKLWPVVT